MEKPLVSVIVPVYNVEAYLDNCINSVINQTYSNWELILVNDGSPDNCPAICDNFAIKDERIKVIHKENGGLSSARNAALEIYKGAYVTFLDSDDFWHINYLDIMIDLCLINDTDIAQCNFIRGIETTFLTTKNHSSVKIFNNKEVFLKGFATIILCAKVYKRHLFNSLRMPIGKINEDDFTTWKTYYNSKKIAVIDRPLYYYTYNVTSIMGNVKKIPRLDFMLAYEERIKYFEEVQDKSMENYSRQHYCKALLLTSTNKMLSASQKEEISKDFISNWKKIKTASELKLPFKILFLLYRYFPNATSKLLSVVYKS